MTPPASAGRRPVTEAAPRVAALKWSIFDGRPLDAFVTGRDGGVSTGPYASLNLALHVGDDPDLVIENRRRAAAALGLALDDMVFCRQTHGRDVTVVGEADRGRGTVSLDDAVPGDAVVTATPGLGLAVMVADCVPLVLYHPAGHVVAAVHAGWRGTVVRVAAAAVEAMIALGADPAGVLAGIGPAIVADRYQVGDEVADAARDCFGGDVDGILRPDGTGRWTFDGWAANRRILVEAGVLPGNIEVGSVGTGPGTPFFSDRAQRPCGRFAAVARLHHR
ncbi:MAG TPA: polyphenol oxidase family protein [Acidimicrobiales bacterium]|nr:polyphenol oxidase family protein [Acidimicrobiales bacterium]